MSASGMLAIGVVGVIAALSRMIPKGTDFSKVHQLSVFSIYIIAYAVTFLLVRTARDYMTIVNRKIPTEELSWITYPPVVAVIGMSIVLSTIRGKWQGGAWPKLRKWPEGKCPKVKEWLKKVTPHSSVGLSPYGIISYAIMAAVFAGLVGLYTSARNTWAVLCVGLYIPCILLIVLIEAGPERQSAEDGSAAET